MTRRRLTYIVLAVVLLVAAGVGGRVAWAQLRSREVGVPTTKVLRGEVDTSINANGELRATRSMTLTAPPVGGQLRLLTLKATSTPIKAGEVVMEFDPSDQEDKLAEQKALLLEAELEIEKLNADRAVQTAKDKVDRLTAEFDVRKAQLDVTGNELVGAIKARQNELTLEEARRRLAQLDEDIKSRATSNEASMAVLIEKRRKAQLAMDVAQQQIASMVVRAPIDGVVSVNSNREGQFGFPGMMFPEYREGDNVSSGRAVAEVLDSGQMEFVARVPETERANLAAGQRAVLTLDGLGGTTLDARVTSVGVGRAGSIFMGRGPEGPVRLIDVALSLEKPLAIPRPGLTAKVRIASDPLKNVLYVPRQAIFDRDGKPLVYVKAGDGFQARQVKVTTRTESAVVISDLPEGAEIALADPDRKPGPKTPAPSAPGGTPARVVIAS